MSCGAESRQRQMIITTTYLEGASLSVHVGKDMCLAGLYTLLISALSESIDEVIEKYNLQRISLLREMVIKTGIQVGIPF